MSKNEYMTVTVPGSKKFSICSRRVGTRDRLSVIATANDEVTAEKIVDALNALQGITSKIDAPALRDLEIARGAIRDLNNKLAELDAKRRRDLVEARDREQKLVSDSYAKDARLSQVSRDLASMTDRANKAETLVRGFTHPTNPSAARTM